MSFSRLTKVATVFLALALIHSGMADAQQFDYQAYPKLNFTFSNLNLELAIDPEARKIKGMAEYSLSANIDGIDTLILEAAHMEIETVRVNDEEAEFRLHNDSLFVSFPGTAAAGQDYRVSIDYETIPRFGILKDDRGTLWTSLLPRSHRHWLPVIDHPRITFKSSMNITVPSGYQAVANGVKLEEEIVDVERVRYTFKTRNKVPATSLAFAVGQFDRAESSVGIKKISLNYEKGLLQESEADDLLKKAVRFLEETKRELDSEYPFERLNLVVLQDHFWETKSWGASTIFLFNNGGDLTTQLKRGIYGQWFGVFQREGQWSDGGAINLLQTALHSQIGDTLKQISRKDHPGKALTTNYDIFGPDRWNNLQQQFDSLEPSFRNNIIQNFSDLLNQGEGVYSFQNYAEFWYKQNGQPVFKLKLSDLKLTDSASSDSVLYRVDYVEKNDNLRLIFTAKKGVYDELVTLPLIQISSSGIDTLEVTFTGAEDSVNIQVPALIKNVKILSADKPNLTLDEYKPASYLIYQLRNAKATEERIEAAKKLGYHSGDPDLQLAIKDFMNQELDPNIKAALLTSLGKIANGASGTQQIFLGALGSDNKNLQKAGLSALQNYTGNESIEEAVRQYALEEAHSLHSFKEATRVLFAMADSAGLESFVSDMVRADTAGHKAIFTIQKLADTGNVGKAVRQAEFYISDVYDYSVRSVALRILIQHDHSQEGWEARARELLKDADPRLRFLTVKGLQKIEGVDFTNILETIIQDEYDQRVFLAMQEVIR